LVLHNPDLEGLTGLPAVPFNEQKNLSFEIKGSEYSYISEPSEIFESFESSEKSNKISENNEKFDELFTNSYKNLHKLEFFKGNYHFKLHNFYYDLTYNKMNKEQSSVIVNKTRYTITKSVLTPLEKLVSN